MGALRIALGVVLAAAAQAAPARLPGDNLFIAGDGFSLEQAISDVAAQRTAGDPPARILVIGAEARRLKKGDASYTVRDLVASSRRAGTAFYVCGKDMRAAGLVAKDLLPGVRAVRGWTDTPAAQAGSEKSGEQYPLAPGRRMRSLCAE
ncbi:MAG: hypothetical protein JSS40_13960 [Proteobacteria bacterium]|nr:hypothetical protein [Pseudomonadota bacterium]